MKKLRYKRVMWFVYYYLVVLRGGIIRGNVGFSVVEFALLIIVLCGIMKYFVVYVLFCFNDE